MKIKYLKRELYKLKKDIKRIREERKIEKEKFIK